MTDERGSDSPVEGVDAWRAGIDAGADPVRLRRIETLARRTAAQQGQARRILEQKLAALMADYGQRTAHGGPTTHVTVASTAASQHGPLSELVKQLAAQAPSHVLHARSATGEPELLRYLQNIWSRLSADRRLTQSLAKVPDKAGPLNSHHLVHRALAAMREASPGYFHHFVSQVDALLALDQMMQAMASPPPAPAAASAPSTRQRKTRTSAGK